MNTEEDAKLSPETLTCYFPILVQNSDVTSQGANWKKGSEDSVGRSHKAQRGQKREFGQ